MKAVICAVHNLKKFISQHFFLFLIIFIGIAFSVFGILFYSGYIANYFCDTSEIQTVTIKIKNNSDKSTINSLVTDLYNISGFNNIVLSNDEPEKYDVLGSLSVIGEYDTDFKDNLIVGNSFDFNSTEKSTLITEYATANLEIQGNPVGSTLSSDKLTVIGVLISNIYEGYIVPVKYYISNYETTHINIGYSTTLGHDLKSIVAEKTSAYSDIITDYMFKNESNPFYNSDFVFTFLQIMLIFFIAIINIFTMIFFWLKTLKNEFKIYMIYGASKINIIITTVLQSLILFLMSSLFGALIFVFLSPSLAQLGIIIEGHFYTYLVTFLIIFLISIINSLVIALKTANQQNIYIIKD